MRILNFLSLLLLLSSCIIVKKKYTDSSFDELYRPQVHFSPPENWMNDPNGMVYLNNKYHLFYQYYPDSTVWGPMHWGHAISKDLIHWQNQKIALYPDSLGYIFSGSAVVDKNNTSGFGKDGKVPLIAIFTHHDPKGEKAGTNDYQNQSLAYSLDEGTTWTKYAGNPVLKNPGIKDFRDPKVMWFEAGKKWIMTLATLDRITFYSSKDLKSWEKESEFGQNFGAHGGVWECPDLFYLKHNNENIWVLLVSINPGGPNGGSATQYFTGQFDGKNFVPYQTDTRWIDYGPDNYAGVTWSNSGERKIFLGWMSNWSYANVVPTEKWRSAMTLPRDLAIEKIEEKYFVTSHLVPELQTISKTATGQKNIPASDYDLTSKIGKLSGPVKLEMSASQIENFKITFYNLLGDKLILGYDKVTNNYYIDRTVAGKVDFEKRFAAKHTAARISKNANLQLTMVLDNSSIELFADNGLSVMTEIFFSAQPLNSIRIQSPDNFLINSLKLTPLESIRR